MQLYYFRADRFIAMRRKAGFSQRTLAESIGVTRVTVEGWECRGRAPHSVNLIRAADAMSVNPRYLLNMVDEP